MGFDILVPLLLGLFSALHCVGMCGGIIGMLGMSLPPSVRESHARLLGYTLAYSVGRIASYGVVGLVAGWLSGWLAGGRPGGGGLVVLRILADIMVVLTGLYYTGWWPHLARVERIGEPLWRRLEPLGRRLLPVRSLPHAVAFGIIWGWLPCGPVYAALALALATGQALQGGLFMTVFGVGTLPTVVTAGMISAWASRVRRAVRAQQVMGLALVVMGLISLWLATGMSGHGAHIHR